MSTGHSEPTVSKAPQPEVLSGDTTTDDSQKPTPEASQHVTSSAGDATEGSREPATETAQPQPEAVSGNTHENAEKAVSPDPVVTSGNTAESAEKSASPQPAVTSDDNRKPSADTTVSRQPPVTSGDTTANNSKRTTMYVNEKTPDSDILWVDWDGPKDPKNPKNWSYRRKWAASIIVSCFTFISPVSSSMVAPAAMQIAEEFGITSSVVVAMTISVFVLGYAVGPLFLGPLSEIYGRSRVIQLANMFYLAFNIGCGFSKNKGQLIAFRFLAGIGGSAPLSVGGGVLADMWHAEERGKAIGIYSLAPLLGPVLGPVCGGWIAERVTWRWVFWSTSIADVVVQAFGIFYLQETFAPVLLERKAAKIKKTMDLENGPYKSVRTVFETQINRSRKAIIHKACIRPFQLLFSEPIIQILAVYMAFVYGIFYLFLTSIPLIFAVVYRERPGISGLNYIALGLGLMITTQICARVLDPLYVHLKKKNGGVGEPEFRLPSMVPGTILLPMGLFLAGWSAQYSLHWIVTDIGIALIGGALILVFMSIQTYIIDTFTLYAASALAATACLRSLAGFGFPLFAPIMFERLGYGKGATVLACLAIGLGCPAPFLLWKYGRRIRMSSKNALKEQQPKTEAPTTEPDVGGKTEADA